MIGDGSYLMMSSEIVTSIQEGIKLIVVLVDNHGFSSIGGLSQSVGSRGFGTRYRYRDPETGELDGEVLPLDFAANARGLGAHVIEASTLPELNQALQDAKAADRTTVIVVETDPEERVPSYESWWDVPIAEVASMESVQDQRQAYEERLEDERTFL
jgi:3D-(3,5/4)-trihydroxycyclohexane-1,2-dione acylhydrolase (decyclizing)